MIFQLKMHHKAFDDNLYSPSEHVKELNYILTKVDTNVDSNFKFGGRATQNPLVKLTAHPRPPSWWGPRWGRKGGEGTDCKQIAAIGAV